ncbi:hypothetical protein J3459_022473 [Metarhizium acridum]|nr:hypothetical protein J3459_022473 [Metarhizium acridum]
MFTYNDCFQRSRFIRRFFFLVCVCVSRHLVSSEQQLYITSYIIPLFTYKCIASLVSLRRRDSARSLDTTAATCMSWQFVPRQNWNLPADMLVMSCRYNFGSGNGTTSSFSFIYVTSGRKRQTSSSFYQPSHELGYNFCGATMDACFSRFGHDADILSPGNL